MGAIKQTKTEAGTYPVKLFTAVEREAYWTGERWVSNEAEKGRKNRDKHLTMLLRYWNREDAMKTGVSTKREIIVEARRRLEESGDTVSIKAALIDSIRTAGGTAETWFAISPCFTRYLGSRTLDDYAEIHSRAEQLVLLDQVLAAVKD